MGLEALGIPKKNTSFLRIRDRSVLGIANCIESLSYKHHGVSLSHRHALGLALVERIAELCCETSATMVVFPGEWDPHPDHRGTHILVKKALAMSSKTGRIQQVVSDGCVGWWLTKSLWDVKRRAYEGLIEVVNLREDEVEGKRRAMAAHVSQGLNLENLRLEVFVQQGH